MIGTSLLAALSDIDSYSGRGDFVETHFESFTLYFKFPYGAPSHDTYQRFWDGIDPEQFAVAFQLFTEILLRKCEVNAISIDGKTIRNSGSERPFHMVSAWRQNHNLVLAQQKLHEKGNEITAIPQLLALLDIRNKIITIDAMGAQRKICTAILEQGGDYLISLKQLAR